MNKQSIFNMIIVALLLVVIGQQYIVQKSLSALSHQGNHYFALGDDGRMIPVLPLDDPYVASDDLDKWIRKAVQSTLFLNSEKYKDSLHDASRFFSRRGWESFTHFFQDSGLAQKLESTGCLVNASLSKISVLEQGSKNGRYQWEISADMAVDEIGCDGSKLNKKLDLVMVRSGGDSPRGISIEDWKVQDAAN